MTNTIRPELEKLLADCGVDAEHVHRDFLYVVASHFAEWEHKQLYTRAEHHLSKTTKGEITLEDTVAFDEGLKIGKQFGIEDMKEQLLSKAVPADVTFDYIDDQDRLFVSVLATDVLADEHDIKDKDKVKIIIVKED